MSRHVHRMTANDLQAFFGNARAVTTLDVLMTFNAADDGTTRA